MNKNCSTCDFENYPILFCADCVDYSDWEKREIGKERKDESI